MADTYRNLPLEERIGALRDGEVTNQGASIGSNPLTVQPKRKHDMSEEIAVNMNAWNVDGRPFTPGEIDDIVTRLLALNHPDAADGADEIERLENLLSRAFRLIAGHGPDFTVWDNWEDAISAYEDRPKIKRTPTGEKWINQPLTQRLAEILDIETIANNNDYWRTIVETINELSPHTTEQQIENTRNNCAEQMKQWRTTTPETETLQNQIDELQQQVTHAHVILKSEPFAWIMTGANHHHLHITQLEPVVKSYWNKYGNYFKQPE
jgi:hypothetical protein